MNAVLSVRNAVLRDWTEAAPGLPWRADERAKLHEGLVELGAGAGGVLRVAWCVKRRGCMHVGLGGQQHHLFREVPETGVGLPLARIAGDAARTRQHAHHIAVQNRLRLIERDAANRPSGVAPD